jgi:hypothetical protein
LLLIKYYEAFSFTPRRNWDDIAGCVVFYKHACVLWDTLCGYLSKALRSLSISQFANHFCGDRITIRTLAVQRGILCEEDVVRGLVLANIKAFLLEIGERGHNRESIEARGDSNRACVNISTTKFYCNLSVALYMHWTGPRMAKVTTTRKRAVLELSPPVDEVAA